MLTSSLRTKIFRESAHSTQVSFDVFIFTVAAKLHLRRNFRRIFKRKSLINYSFIYVLTLKFQEDMRLDHSFLLMYCL